MRKERVQMVLAAIIENPCVTIRALAEELDIPKNTVSRIIKSLQEDGAVKREGSTKKGRWVVL